MSTGNRLDVVDVGGGVVLRPFTNGTVRHQRNDRLSREELLKIPPQTREALINTNCLREWLNPPAGTETVPVKGQRFIVRNASDPKLYDVVVGTKINVEPMARDKAEALARESLT
jgi:hypothetical protein